VASTKYSYVKTTDFPNNKVDVDALIDEIRNSAIITAVDYVVVKGNDVDLWMKGPLSAGDKVILDNNASPAEGLVGAHQGEPLPPGVMLVDIGAPKTSDGKPIFLTNQFPGNVTTYLPGAGDDLAPTPPATGRGQGPRFKLSSEAAGTVDLEWQFVDWVYVSGGVATFQGGELDDETTYKIYAPASTAVVNGGNTGNVDLVDVGGINKIVPASPPNTGSHDVDLADGTKFIPVPAPEDAQESPTGQWDWDEPDEGLGTLTENNSGKGQYDLYDAPLDLVQFAPNIQLLGAGDVVLEPGDVKPKKVLPHWVHKVSMTNGGHAGLKMVWHLTCARVKTV
jgi:hypothetical protein